MIPLILASASVSRLSLLRAAGVDAAVRPSGVDEAVFKRAARDPAVAAMALAEAKAKATAGAGVAAAALVLGADQILVCGERWFDKPRDLDEARGHLRALRGRTHELVTAAALVRDGAVVWRCLARPALTMRAFSDAFLGSYVAREGEALLATVGAYRLEGLGLQLFDRVEGEHGAILGLPLLALLAALRDLGALPA